MIESLIAGRPFLYQGTDRAVYHVTQNGVEAIQLSWSPETHIIAFIDGVKDTEPHDILKSPLVQLIVATSPKGAEQKWIKQYNTGDKIVRKLATRLWKRREFFLTGLVFTFFLPTLG
jgi:hypothetical protein